MKLYFIRHIPSGMYLPTPTGRGGRGGSHTEPDHSDHARIFHSKLAAQRALSSWLKGKFVCSQHYDYEGECYEEISIILQPDRIKSDMEIIEKEIIL